MKKSSRNLEKPPGWRCALPLLISLVFLNSAGAVRGNSPLLHDGQVLTVRTTAYNHHEEDHIQFGKRNALGYELRDGSDDKPKSAAADWSRFPVGTRFQLVRTGDLYEVDDYGIALVGTETLDLYMPTIDDMNKWGARREEIRILKIGSFERSLVLLGVARQHEYIKTMKKSVLDQVNKRKNYRAPTASTGPRPRGMPAPIDERQLQSRKPAPVDPNAINARKPK